jgi:hypothetical protein
VAYEAAGQRLVARCDVLLGLWNGEASGGRGGTAETLLVAASRGKPCIWLATGGDGGVTDNLAPGAAAAFRAEVARRAAVEPAGASPPVEPASVLESLHAAHAGLDELNDERVRTRHAGLVEELAPGDRPQRWIDPPFQRVDLLAGLYQRRFRTSAWLLSLLATVAGVLLGVSAAFEVPEAVTWAELACLLVAGGVYSIARRRRFHDRWLAYRMLAERLRSARFLAPTGVDYRRAAPHADVGGEGGDDDPVARATGDAWVMRAFEEVWGNRPAAAGGPPDAPPPDALRQAIAEQWIGGQMTFHHRAAARHARALRNLNAGTSAAFALTIVAVLLHALGVRHEEALLFSIALPAAGASLAALASVGQHRVLARRYAQMHADLAVIGRAAAEATSLAELRAASSDAARVIAQEGGDWFGAMWFLDVEHV